MQVHLAFGENAVFEVEIAEDCVRGVHTAAQEGSLSDPAGALALALEQPFDFPPLSRTVVPGDRIVLALDSSVPQLPLVVGEIVSVLLAAQVEPGDLTLLTSSDCPGSEDPRAALATPIAERIEVCKHDPSDEQQLGYLSATAGENRIYLNRRLIDADFIVPVARMGVDPLLGYRPTTGALFPDFSNEAALKRIYRRLPTEAARADAEAVCREIEEVAWLAGLQFAVEVLDDGADGMLAVSAGAIEALANRRAKIVEKYWQTDIAEPADTVVATVECGARGASLADLGAALESATAAVKPEGRIVLLTNLGERPQAGMAFVRASEEPEEALPQLRRYRPNDCVAAHQLIMAVQHAKVFLLSGWDSNLVEDLFLVPLESTSEAQRVLEDTRSCLFLGNAHRMRVRVNGAKE